MKPRLISPWLAVGLALLGALTLSLPGATRPSAPARGPWAAQWQAVTAAAAQGQPRTALERLQPIEAGALQAKNWPEWVRAVGSRIAFETEIQGGLPEERLKRLRAVLADAPAPTRALLESLAGHATWAYFQQNRWRIQQRTALAEGTDASGEDIAAWDLKRIFTEIDRHFSRALADPKPLQESPIQDWDGLLEAGTLPDRYRPTLYDFLVHQALEFYTAGEQAGARPEDAFVVSADSPVFDDLDAFLAWQPEATDTRSPSLKAIRLHQELLRFHRPDREPAALADADLARLAHARQVARGPETTARALAALQRFATRWSGDEISSRALHERASLLREQGRLAEAHAVASEGARAFPNSPGAALCRNLIKNLEAPDLSLQTERVWSPPFPATVLHHRNVPKVWFRAVAVDWAQFLERTRPRPENLSREQRLEYLRRPAAAEWAADLPPTPDFLTRRTEVPAPAGLAPGYYFLFASHRADFAPAENRLAAAEVWVSDLALVLRPRAGRLEGFVLDANSGEPVVDATVEGWELDQAGNRVSTGTPRTDAQGFFVFPDRSTQRPYLLRARKDGHAVALAHELWWPRESPPQSHWQTTQFFTDRALYRPGQLIQYKGICLRHDVANRNYTLLPGQQVVVVFRDPNGKDIARQTLVANAYGSFAGTFTAPRDRATGSHFIAVDGEPQGMTMVQVEEYKRPKFQVTLDAPKSPPRLNDAAVVTGRALAYTGAAIDGAQVTWRVTRQVRFPPWWGWFRRGGPWPGAGESQEIAHGTTRTDAAGTFELAFRALPDPSAQESDQPTFHFEVHADVTDAAGETRSDTRSVHVGFTALELGLSAPDWLTPTDPVPLRIETRSLDGEGLAAEGTVRIHRLRAPEQVARPPLAGDPTPWFRGGRAARPDDSGAPPDLSDPNQWELGDVAAEQAFRTDAQGLATNRVELPAGLYRAVVETRDRFGKPVTGRQPLRVLDPRADRLNLRIPHLLDAPTWTVEPGAEFEALWGTGYESGRAFVEIEEQQRIVARFWTEPGRTQQRIRHAVTEAHRGGFTLHVTQVRDHRAHLATRTIQVPWSNKELELSWETFRSKLEPGARETWTAVVRRRAGVASEKRPLDAADAELVATLYDASLDAFFPFQWPDRFGFFPTQFSPVQHHFSNGPEAYRTFSDTIRLAFENVELRYRRLPPELRFAESGAFRMTVRTMSAARGGMPMPMPMAVADVAAAPAPASAPGMEPQLMRRYGLASPSALAEGAALAKGLSSENEAAGGVGGGAGPGTGPGAPRPNPAAVSARKNLNETAFFLPQSVTDSNGVVRLSFTLPEALTEWRFLGFAHDRQLRSGLLEARAVSAKDLMVQPNPPRFLREGDTLEFTVKLSNRSEARQTGRARLALAFALDGAPADRALGNTRVEQAFDIPARESRTLSWRLEVPDGCGFLTYKATAATATLSDGEEGFLPVLSRRVFVTESLPLPIRGPGETTFDFARLRDSRKSRSLRHESFTVQMVSNPAWYAVLALPYLMEFPHECAEQTFNRLYANALARHIAVRDPKIRAVFDQWRATPALDSPLHRNEDLKSVQIEETPWLRQADSESQARRQIGVLFEQTRLEDETERTLRRLSESQLPEGGWAWFPGGRRSDTITLYLVTGFGRLRHLGVDLPMDAALRALGGLDAWMAERHRRLREDHALEGNHLDSSIAFYLYGRSFFLADQAVAPDHQAALDYWLDQAQRHWLKLDRQSQGHLALALHRWKQVTPARAILRSLEERSVTDPELGRFWRDTELGWGWFQAPIETQALMIEAFSEVTENAPVVEELRVWLLKQKQTRNWKTTKATADAVYALLLRGTDLLAAHRLVEVEAGGRNLTPGAAPAASRRPERADAAPVEAGTGFYEVRIPGAEVKPALAALKVRKTDPGIAWGGAYWQYFETLEAVKPLGESPLHLAKRLFVRTQTKDGPALKPVGARLQVGDELVVRIELRADRDMEYVHLKDQRGSGTEPVNVLSGYRYQDGLGYYESTRDTASHFFIEYLPKGTHVFEYPVRVQHRGEYPSGIATVQCMYAPEFGSHSGSTSLRVE